MTKIERIQEAIDNGEVLEIEYNGGTRPGELREIAPLHTERHLVGAICLIDEHYKNFKISKIRIMENGKVIHNWSRLDPQAFLKKRYAKSKEFLNVVRAKNEKAELVSREDKPNPDQNNFKPGKNNPRARLPAAYLAFFFGGLGAHKFYLGQYYQGILYIAFFWTYVPFILGVLEGVLLYYTSEKVFFDRYK